VRADGAPRTLESISWFHTIELPGGVRTPGRDDSTRKLAQLGLPDRLDGLSVLDIGTWDGFFAFECERRGAARVVATDHVVWGRPDGRAGFDFARAALGSRVEPVDLDVAEHSPARLGTFDLVLFLGVLYHLPDPVGGLAAVSSVTAGRLILETHVAEQWRRRPVAAFYPGDELDGDATNWWGPNPASLEGMLRAVGFGSVDVASTRSRSRRLARALRLRGRGVPFFRSLQEGRVVAHAAK